MPKIYLINVGANAAHQAKVRSPLFKDGTFEFITFPDDCGAKYPTTLKGFVRNATYTHLDPDWKNLTYGDNCSNARASALQKALAGDILLFWALLWKVDNRSSDVFAESEKGWFLIGAQRIECVLESGDPLDELTPSQRKRARWNAHVTAGTSVDGNNEKTRVFIGDHYCPVKNWLTAVLLR